MKNSLKLFVVLLFIVFVHSSCERIEYGKEAFLGDYTTEIDYANSTLEMAPVDPLNPDSLVYSPVDEDSKKSFIDSCFTVGAATISDLGGDSIRYVDADRTLDGCVKTSVTAEFVTTELGSVPDLAGVTIDSTILNATAKLKGNNVHLTYNFSGDGSVVLSPTITLYGKVRGTVKMIAK